MASNFISILIPVAQGIDFESPAFHIGAHAENATPQEWWTATCFAVRDRLLDRFMTTQETHHKKKARRAYYLSWIPDGSLAFKQSLQRRSL